MILDYRAQKSLAIIAFLLLGATRLTLGGELPAAPKNYFNDYAGVTGEGTTHELNERLAKFEKETTNQIVVAIFPKMDSTLSLDDYTLRLANAWGIGQRGKNNGVALFIFIQDHTMRVQVGYGLTSVLKDEVSRQILDRDLKPHFQKGDFDGGLVAGVDSILKVLGAPAPEQAGQK